LLAGSVQVEYNRLCLVFVTSCRMFYVMMKICTIEVRKNNTDNEEEAAPLYIGSTRRADVTP
jgi:hypothetical protein